jgi:RNA polymerase sigma factor (sigma-70 family)
VSLDSTTQLLAASRAGDSQAVNRLFTRCLSSLIGWASGRLPRSARSAVDTSDLIQDTVAATFSRIVHFEPRRSGSLRGYLRTAYTNRVKDEIRRAHRRPLTGEIEADEIASPARSPLDGLLDRETAARFAAALSALSEQDQMAVISRYELGYSYKQIGVVLGKTTPEAARKSVTRAIERLAREMARVDPDLRH